MPFQSLNTPHNFSDKAELVLLDFTREMAKGLGKQKQNYNIRIVFPESTLTQSLIDFSPLDLDKVSVDSNLSTASKISSGHTSALRDLSSRFSKSSDFKKLFALSNKDKHTFLNKPTYRKYQFSHLLGIGTQSQQEIFLHDRDSNKVITSDDNLDNSYADLSDDYTGASLEHKLDPYLNTKFKEIHNKKCNAEKMNSSHHAIKLERYKIEDDRPKRLNELTEQEQRCLDSGFSDDFTYQQIIKPNKSSCLPCLNLIKSKKTLNLSENHPYSSVKLWSEVVGKNIPSTPKAPLKRPLTTSTNVTNKKNFYTETDSKLYNKLSNAIILDRKQSIPIKKKKTFDVKSLFNVENIQNIELSPSHGLDKYHQFSLYSNKVQLQPTDTQHKVKEVKKNSHRIYNPNEVNSDRWGKLGSNFIHTLLKKNNSSELDENHYKSQISNSFFNSEKHPIHTKPSNGKDFLLCWNSFYNISNVDKRSGKQDLNKNHTCVLNKLIYSEHTRSPHIYNDNHNDNEISSFRKINGYSYNKFPVKNDQSDLNFIKKCFSKYKYPFESNKPDDFDTLSPLNWNGKL